MNSANAPLDANLEDAYFRSLDDWHLQDSMVQAGIQRSVMDLDDDVDEGRLCILNILSERLAMLVRSCPFPSLR